MGIYEHRLNRCFIALIPDAKTLDRVVELQTTLAQDISQVRWITREKLHITLCYIGKLSQTHCKATGKALHKLTQQQKSFTAQLKAPQWFPNRHKPQVIALNISHPAMTVLAINMRHHLDNIGINTDSRPFRGHLSLARMKKRHDTHPINPINCDITISMPVTQLFLLNSEESPTGNQYRLLANCKFETDRLK